MKKALGVFFILYSLFPQVRAQQMLSLDDCRILAVENNKQLKISEENRRKASEEKKAAFTQYLPDVSLTGAYLYNQKSISLLSEDKYLPIGTLMPDGSFGFTQEQVNNRWTLVNGNPVPLDANGVPFDPKQEPGKILWKNHAIIPKDAFDMDIHNVFVGGVSVKQPLFMGGKIAAYNKITGYAEALAIAMQEKEVQEVVLQIDRAYWQIISLTGKYRLAKQYVDLLRQMDNDVQALFKQGIATRAEGLSVKVKLNEADMTLTQVENGLQLSRMALCQLCGLPVDESIVLTDENNTELSAENYTAPSFAMENVFDNRPEIQALDLAKRIFEKKEAVVRADMLPSLALVGNYLVTNPNSFNGFQNKFAGSWNVGILLNVPVFHWGETQHKLRAAQAETRVRQLEKDEAKEKIKLQVKQCEFKLSEAHKKAIAAGKNKESAEENLRYANLGFKEGVIPALNVMEAQTAWFKAQSEYIDAVTDVRIGQTELNKALGISIYTGTNK
ncbi:alkaline protease [Bacteroidia bacterium]|nr:alkaline protease [Bacteroidia bacterium]